MADPQPRLDDLRIERRVKPESRSSLWWLGIGVVVLGLGAGAWSVARPKPVEVRTVLVRAATGGGADHTVLNASGYVTARRAATVSSKITGKVTEVLIEEGMKVKEGQIVARLEDTN